MKTLEAPTPELSRYQRGGCKKMRNRSGFEILTKTTNLPRDFYGVTLKLSLTHGEKRMPMGE
jgi:hypothetical protein